MKLCSPPCNYAIPARLSVLPTYNWQAIWNPVRAGRGWSRTYTGLWFMFTYLFLLQATRCTSLFTACYQACAVTSLLLSSCVFPVRGQMFQLTRSWRWNNDGLPGPQGAISPRSCRRPEVNLTEVSFLPSAGLHAAVLVGRTESGLAADRTNASGWDPPSPPSSPLLSL